MNFKGKRIAVIGAGTEGLSSEKYLKAHGAEVDVIDEGLTFTQANEAENRKKPFENLDKYDLIVRSPGVHFDKLKKADPKKITSQVKLFFDLCPAEIIGVTGTKGKGTTSSLIYEMLKKQSSSAKASGDKGFDVYLGGNIGVPPFEFLDTLTKDSKVVLEMSSFQLIDLDKSPADAKAMAGKPHIAVILMITSEHLDWHKDVHDYIMAKRNILKYQKSGDFAVVNRDYPAANESDIHTEGKIYYTSRERQILGEGCFVDGNAIVIRSKGNDIEVIKTEEILLPGKHNFENACAAAMAAYLSGVSASNIRHVLKTFKGLEHRLELVAEINGVRYYDDSFSTTPETAIAAIEAFKEPEILILGGSSKGSDFTELGELISKKDNIKAIIGVGVEWPVIKSKIKNQISNILIIEGADSMEKIVVAASKIALPGDVVVLSPACASFDMFKNYKDRGNQFKEQVSRLKS